MGFTSVSRPGSSATQIGDIDKANASHMCGVFADTAGPPNLHPWYFNGTTWTTLPDVTGGGNHSAAIRLSGDLIVVQPLVQPVPAPWTGGFASYLYSISGASYGSAIAYPSALSTAVNDIDGTTVVGVYQDSSGKGHGFKLVSSTYTSIDVPNASFTTATCVSGSNIAGMYVEAGFQGGFFFDGSNYTRVIPTGAVQTAILGISGSTVCGHYWDGSQYHGFTWSPSGGFSIYNYPSAGHTWLSDISGSNLAGNYTSSSIPNQGGHGFLWNGSSFVALDNNADTTPERLSGSTLVGKDVSGWWSYS